MSWQLDLRRPAVQDIAEAKAWYSRQRDDLGGVFLDAAFNEIRSVIASPLQYPVRFRRTRRALLRRFPYAVYYRIKGDTVVVIAVVHTRRDPHVWQVREVAVAYDPARRAA